MLTKTLIMRILRLKESYINKEDRNYVDQF